MRARHEDGCGLQVRQVRAAGELSERVERLYLDAFPEHEIIPFPALLGEAAGGEAELCAYLDADELCAMTFSVELERYLFVLYLAVAAPVRSRGYGSRVLALLAEHAAGRCLVLDAEAPGSGAVNEVQRKRRLSFYRRAGFFETGHRFFDGCETYCTLACGGGWNEGEFLAAARSRGGVMEDYYGDYEPIR